MNWLLHADGVVAAAKPCLAGTDSVSTVRDGCRVDATPIPEIDARSSVGRQRGDDRLDRNR